MRLVSDVLKRDGRDAAWKYLSETNWDEKGQRCVSAAGYIFNVVETYFVPNDTEIAQKKVVRYSVFCLNKSRCY